MSILETRGLGRRYGGRWALRDCDLTIPEGHLVALVGPNGAGKSTLLNVVVGLTTPSTGEVTVLDGKVAGSAAALDEIAFVAQSMPLYRHLSVRDMLHLTRNLNRTFDGVFAKHRLADLGIDPRQKVGRLSGGQHAQLALTLALARRPRLLVLDEPTASLDPLARHDFLAAVMTAMADDGVSVVLSSHILTELERVADYLVLILDGRVRLEGPVEDHLARHLLVVGPADLPTPPDWEVVESRTTGVQTHRLVRVAARSGPVPAGWEARPVGVEELALAYLRGGAAEARVLAGVAS
jgi:ABC-2 type transport system ATP-binding protein